MSLSDPTKVNLQLDGKFGGYNTSKTGLMKITIDLGRNELHNVVQIAKFIDTNIAVTVTVPEYDGSYKLGNHFTFVSSTIKGSGESKIVLQSITDSVEGDNVHTLSCIDKDETVFFTLGAEIELDEDERIPDEDDSWNDETELGSLQKYDDSIVDDWDD